MDIEKALEKIKKCLALSRSSNEHEAAQALKHAHALMQKYNLDLDDVSKSELSLSSNDIKSAVTNWHALLITTIGNAFSAVPIKSGDTIKWHGYGISAELASYTYDVLFKQCNQARTHYLKTELKAVRKKSNKTLRANIYAEAWCAAIKRAVDAFVSNDEKEVLNNISELVSKGTETYKPRDRNSYKNAKSHVKDAANSDYQKGYQAGKKVHIHRPVGHDSQRSIE